MNYGKKTSVTPPTPRPTYANPNHPMNREGRPVITKIMPTSPKPRPKRVYNGMTGNYSTD